MKKYILPIVLAGLFAACTEDEVYDNFVPVQEGEEIQFGSTLTTGEGTTRTEYGDLVTNADGSKYFPVYWETGDRIIICCPESNYPYVPGAKGYQKTALYKITANETSNKHIAASVDKAENKALQWGAPGVHHFYSIYPASAVGTVNDKGFYAVVEPYQQAKAVVLKGNTYEVQPNMDHALMMGYSEYDTSVKAATNAIDLKFKPIMTVLEVTINGPKEANTGNINISKITVSSTDGTPISGTYELHVNPVDGSITEAISKDPNKATSSITVSTLNEKGVELKKGEKAVYKIFLAPNVDETVQLKVAVGTQFGTLTKTLNKTHIQKQKVNRVTLPDIKRDAANNYWISDLDPNIYISELSYPGSKMSFLTERYQNVSVQAQFDYGVRAFIIQSQIRNGEVVIAGEGGAIQDNNDYVPVTNAVNLIAKKMNSLNNEGKAMNEFVIVMFTFYGNGSEADYGENSGQTWMKKLRQTCQKMGRNSNYRIYTNEVTPDTRIADVKGKIILKANYNEEEMFKGLRGTAPLLLSHWMNAYPQSNENFANGVPLYWSNITNSPKMKWFYQEVTVVKDDESLDENKTEGYTVEATYDQKVQYMKNIFTKSLDLYKDDNLHDIWYVNDLGGILVHANTKKNGAQKLATKIHPEASTILRQRKENASLGLIFMNFADRDKNSGVLYGSDWLIQTIIDNNFKFGLRKASGTSVKAPTRVVEGASDDEWDK